MNKVPLIYIAGTGRCGSTILDMLLGSHPHTFSLGEFQTLPWELKLEKKCTCGEKLPQCPFWRPLIKNNESLINDGNINKFREAPGSGSVLRAKYFRAIWTGNDTCLEGDEIKSYGKSNYQLMESVFERAREFKGAELRYLVDSSKDLYRLFFLQQSRLFDIKVIHLYKKPQAFVYSMIKKREGLDREQKTVRFTGRWIVENWLIEKVCENFFSREDVMKVLYDDFAGRPKDEMSKLCNRLGLNENVSPEIIDRFQAEAHHNISGNKARFESKGIVLDEKWKSNLAVLKKLFVRSLTWKQYGRYNNQRLRPS